MPWITVHGNLHPGLQLGVCGQLVLPVPVHQIDPGSPGFHLSLPSTCLPGSQLLTPPQHPMLDPETQGERTGYTASPGCLQISGPGSLWGSHVFNPNNSLSAQDDPTSTPSCHWPVSSLIFPSFLLEKALSLWALQQVAIRVPVGSVSSWSSNPGLWFFHRLHPCGPDWHWPLLGLLVAVE